MNILKLALLLAIAAGAYNYWRQHQAPRAHEGGHESASDSANGFVPLPPVRGQSPSAILVVAAEDCPHDDAQRADRLADDLSRSGLPVVRIHDLTFDVPGGGSADLERINAVMGGALPVVFVRGRAKANPSLDQVLAEYRGAAQ